jgi:uncharacterized membrane protein YphA (DoxX/SURF4 family)
MTKDRHPGGGKPTFLNVTLWVAQILLFASFAWAGWMKLTSPIPALAAMWPWTEQLPEAVVRGLGAIDLAGGIGVLLPALTRIKPGLTVLAALGCVLLQICAAIFHASRGEMQVLPVNAIFLALAAYILWGRRRLPIAKR